ncbi:signal peptidase subunit-domain-containing protein [Amanita rubescens]|nr:signal peptidase subunit-domain-containing protein [Amanita rubescens]
MHTTISRINNLSAFLSSCMMALLAAIALSSFLFSANPTGIVDITSLKVYHASARRYNSRKQELAFVNFNITADLTSLFHWNTKQLFVYLQAEHDSAQSVSRPTNFAEPSANTAYKDENAIVIWDRIIRRKEDAHINFSGKNKYMLRELSSSFKSVSRSSPTSLILT